MHVLPHHEATRACTEPVFIPQAGQLIEDLHKFKIDELAALMKMSQKLALLNYDRFANWRPKHTTQNSAPAMYSFTGEAYRGLDAASLSAADAAYAQQTLRILSGLYGVIRPLDLIQPYRLEMGTRHGFWGKKNLYAFWADTITQTIIKAVEESPGEKFLVNLASNEYLKAIDVKKFKNNMVNVSFYEEKDQQLKMVTVYAKKARGMMARFIIENRIEKLEELRAFDSDGYFFSNQHSEANHLVFVR